MTEKLSVDKSRFDDIDYNLAHIRERIAQAAQLSCRKAEDITLMAVTKTVEPIYINHALEQGIDLIGENKVQEYLGKKPYLKPCNAHLIGHLQTNKVRQIVGEVSMIQSVDSLRLAQEIGKRSVAAGIVTDVLAEINVGGEESKTGIAWDESDELIHQLTEIDGICLRGLMSIPPICDNSVQVRRYFCKMHQKFVDIRAKKLDNSNVNILSMGMSSDYYDAIAEGSTLVRVGTALFGKRVY